MKRLVVLLPLERETRRGWLYIAPSEAHLPRGDAVEPDLFFVLSEIAHVRRGSHVEGAPSAAFEVVSPTSRYRDRVVKRALFASARVPEYWIVDPGDRTVTALVLRNGRYVPLPWRGSVVDSEVLSGFLELFASPAVPSD